MNRAPVSHRRPTSIRATTGACATVALLFAAGCTTPKQQANMAEAINEAGTAVSAMQQDIGDLQSSVDSLKVIVAHQDTIITKLANIANLPLH